MDLEIRLTCESQGVGTPHPECLLDEVHIGWVYPESFPYIGWKTKRLSPNIRKDGQASMFVKRSEVQAAIDAPGASEAKKTALKKTLSGVV